MLIELAIESSEFGIYITYDGDRHKVLCGTNCGLCRDYFESEKIEGFCERCRQNKIIKFKKGEIEWKLILDNILTEC